MTKEQWLAIRKEAAVKIDPETAKVVWGYGSVRNPYGLYDLTDEEDNIGLNYFARSPESEVWVVFRDLPAPTRDRLRARIAAGDAPADDGWLGWAGDALSQEAMATTDITTNNITVAATPGATSKRGSTPHSRLGTRKNGQRINLQELQARPAFYLLGLLQEGRTRSQDQEKRKPSKCPP